jgi:hypothetical protein
MEEDAKVIIQEKRRREFEEKDKERRKKKDKRKEEKRKRKQEKEEHDVGGGEEGPRRRVRIAEEPEGAPEVDRRRQREAEDRKDCGEDKKQKKEDKGEEGDVDMGSAQGLVEAWVCEVVNEMGDVEEEDHEGDELAWDDVHGGELPIEEVKKGRKEEVGFMNRRKLWTLRPIKECFEKTGKPPVSTRWVDTNKAHELDGIDVRCRLVARNFKGGDKDRDDLFAETPPLEAKRLLMSRAVTRRKDGRVRKLLFIDVRKAHLNPPCEGDVYIELPAEAECPEGMCGKLDFWLYVFRPAAAAWEKHYSGKLESVGFVRGVTCGVVFYHPGRDISLAVHGDDFTSCASGQLPPRSPA